MLTETRELVEVAELAISQTEDKFGKYPFRVSEDKLHAWAKSYGMRRFEELLDKEFQAHATHPDFLMVSDTEQEELHLDTNSEVIKQVIDELITSLDVVAKRMGEER